MNVQNGAPVTQMTSVPSEFRKRKRLWIYSGLWLNHIDCPYACLSVQTLGYAERLLPDMEARLAVLAKDAHAKKERDLLLSECSAHSVLWVFGLYEVLRTIRESGAPQFVPLIALFEKLEALRMPLAEHEAKRLRGSAPSHYPTSCWDIENGHVGWSVYDPRLGKMRILARTPLANEFLAIAAVEPDSLPPFPIGGPLGEFED
jgi:hypothetical protein